MLEKERPAFLSKSGYRASISPSVKWGRDTYQVREGQAREPPLPVARALIHASCLPASLVFPGALQACGVDAFKISKVSSTRISPVENFKSRETETFESTSLGAKKSLLSADGIPVTPEGPSGSSA